MSTLDSAEAENELKRNELALKKLVEERIRLLGASAPELAGEIVELIEQKARRAEVSEKFRSSVEQPKPVVIVGGAGGMGRQLRRSFEKSGWPVRIIGRHDWDRAAEILEGAGTVIVSVPIDATLAVIGDLKGLVPRDALLCDVTSIKAAPLEAMLKAHDGPVAGLHPMFGPDVDGFAGQVVVYAPGRDAKAAEPLLEQIRIWGAKVVTCSAEDHDRSMGIIQALRHFTTYAYGVFLAKLHPDLSVILQLSSPIYRLELEMVGRLFAQDPKLYAEIILANNRNVQLIRDYVQSLRPELDMVEAHDRDEFVKRFTRVRDYFGDLAPAFMKESGKMLNLIQAERRSNEARGS